MNTMKLLLRSWSILTFVLFASIFWGSVGILSSLSSLNSLSAAEEEPPLQLLWQSDGTAAEDKGVAISVYLRYQTADAGKTTGAEADLVLDMHALDQTGEVFHIYAFDTDIGMPTALKVNALLKSRGKLSSDSPRHKDEYGLHTFNPGVVRLIQPVWLPAEAGTAEIALTYMSCSETRCLSPAIKRAITLKVPGATQSADSMTAVVELDAGEDVVAAAIRRNEIAHKQNADASGIHWRHPTTVAELEELIAAEHAAGNTVLLDFTGPLCTNCQVMAKNIFINPEISAAWNSAVPVELDIDTYPEFSAWQQKHYGSFTRPMYVRLDLDGSSEKWNQYFWPSDTVALAQFENFLSAAGAGNYTGSGDTWWEFVLLALGGGLFTLLMPCTYPMLPLTINFFNKQASAGRRLLPLALSYAFGIMASFTLIGVVIGVVLNKSIEGFGNNPWTNLVIGLVFILLGLSLLGVFFLRLPQGLTSKMGAGQSGYIGALLMGLTFAITAFTCTAPFAGAVLAKGVSDESIFRPAIGMLLYSSVIAIPFFFLSLSPKLLQKMPKAGSWMNEVKVVGGVIEIAAAFKFLAMSDFLWGWDVIGRSFCLAVWSISGAFCAVYLVGLVRMKGDEVLQGMRPFRVLLALGFLALALYLGYGLFGGHLGIVEGWFPGDPVSTMN